MLLIFSLPYLYDFAVGVLSVIFIGRIAEFNDKKKKLKDKKEEEERQGLLKKNVS